MSMNHRCAVIGCSSDGQQLTQWKSNMYPLHKCSFGYYPCVCDSPHRCDNAVSLLTLFIVHIACIAQMQSIPTDELAWSVGLFICLLVTTVSRAKTAEPVEMPFGGRGVWIHEPKEMGRLV